MEGEYAREVHGPDANGCARDASHQPSNPRTPASRADALGEIEPGVRAENGDRNGQSDQTQIVRTDENHVLGNHRFVPSHLDPTVSPMSRKTLAGGLVSRP